MFQLAEHLGQIILECLINGLWYEAKIRKAVLPFAIICQSKYEYIRSKGHINA